MQTPNLDFLKPHEDNLDTKIPIPDPSFLKTELPAIPRLQPVKKVESKYDKYYDKFCRWAALPYELREPKTLNEFEKKYGIVSGQTRYFRERDDYQQKRVYYFYEWMMDLWPDLVYKAYHRAMEDSTADFKILAELVGKKIDVEKPQMNISPMVIVGVSQEKIDKLFTPKSFENPPKIIEGTIGHGTSISK